MAAIGTGADDVTVRKELARLGVVELLGPSFVEIALRVDRREEPLADLVMPLDIFRRMGAAERIEGDAEAGEVEGLPVVVFLYDLFRSRVLLRGGDRDRH